MEIALAQRADNLSLSKPKQTTLMHHYLYSETQIQIKLTSILPTWNYVAGKLQRTYSCNGWRASVMLFNAIAHLAEAAWHHPEIEITWGTVTVNLISHDANGITDKDFELATQIEHWITWQPTSDSALEGTPPEGSWQYRT